MAIRVRKDGTMWCAALTPEMEGDTYIDDGLHYQMSVEKGVIVALPMPEHKNNPQWWWAVGAPSGCDGVFVPQAAEADRDKIARELEEAREALALCLNFAESELAQRGINDADYPDHARAGWIIDQIARSLTPTGGGAS